MLIITSRSFIPLEKKSSGLEDSSWNVPKMKLRYLTKKYLKFCEYLPFHLISQELTLRICEWTDLSAEKGFWR